MANSVTTVIRGKSDRPPKILIHGEHKIGKTEFAAGAKQHVFIGNENGAPQIEINRFPTPATWGEVIEQVLFLLEEQHDYRALVLDTLDWLEPVLWDDLCRNSNNKSHIEDFGYGKGYELALDEWRKFLRMLEKLNERRQMTIIALAHSHVRNVQNAEGSDYDRWELKFHKKAWPLWCEWVDVIGFATKPIKVDKNGKATPGAGRHVLRTRNSPAFVAGSRWSLPDPIELSWAPFAKAMMAAGAFKAPPKTEESTKNEDTETTPSAA